MKNPNPGKVPIVRDLPLNLMREIGRVVVFYAYVEWRLNLIIYDFLRITKVLSHLVAKDARATDQFDLICDLISLKNVNTGVDLIRLRKSLVSATTQWDMLAHGTWLRDPRTKIVSLHLAKGGFRAIKNNGRKKQTKEPRLRQYGIEECRALSQLINGIILTVEELYSDLPDQSMPKLPARSF
jgi:hypothetical protein